MVTRATLNWPHQLFTAC